MILMVLENHSKDHDYVADNNETNNNNNDDHGYKDEDNPKRSTSMVVVIFRDYYHEKFNKLMSSKYKYKCTKLHTQHILRI